MNVKGALKKTYWNGFVDLESWMFMFTQVKGVKRDSTLLHNIPGKVFEWETIQTQFIYWLEMS